MHKKMRDAKIQNGRYDRQERLDCVDEILANQDPPCVHSNVCNEKECPCEEYEEDSDYYFDDERKEDLGACDLPNCFNKAFYSFRNMALRICFECFTQLYNDIPNGDYDVIKKGTESERSEEQ